MENILLVAYLLIVLALIAVILVQRSEGGGLGMGTAGGMMTVRGSANLLTRTTGVLAALFFATAIGLTVLSELDRGTDSILDQAASGPQNASTVLEALSQLQAGTAGTATVDPSSSVPAGTDGIGAGIDPGLALPVTPAAPASAAAPSSAAPASSSAASEPSASSVAPAPSNAASAPISAPAP